MTTDIRAESVALLAEALRKVEPPDPVWVDSIADPPSVPDANWPGWAALMLRASPVLARRLSFATAWDEAVAALPEGWFCVVQRVWSGAWEAYAMPATHSPRQSSKGATPTDALVALAEALRERAR